MGQLLCSAMSCGRDIERVESLDLPERPVTQVLISMLPWVPTSMNRHDALQIGAVWKLSTDGAALSQAIRSDQIPFFTNRLDKSRLDPIEARNLAYLCFLLGKYDLTQAVINTAKLGQVVVTHRRLQLSLFEIAYMETDLLGMVWATTEAHQTNGMHPICVTAHLIMASVRKRSMHIISKGLADFPCLSNNTGFMTEFVKQSIEWSNVEALKLAVPAYISPDAHVDERPLLTYACDIGCSEDIIMALMECGCDPSSGLLASNMSTRTIAMLVDRGAKVRTKQTVLFTLIMRERNLESLKLLLAAGATPDDFRDVSQKLSHGEIAWLEQHLETYAQSLLHHS